MKIKHLLNHKDGKYNLIVTRNFPDTPVPRKDEHVIHGAEKYYVKAVMHAYEDSEEYVVVVLTCTGQGGCSHGCTKENNHPVYQAKEQIDRLGYER